MNTSVDTNVFVALWDEDSSVSEAAQRALDLASEQGEVVVCAPVYSELLANRGRSKEFLDRFFATTGIRIDWMLGEAVWRSAGAAFGQYAERRRRHGAAAPRRILADFLIAAHAVQNHCQLLTLDDQIDGSLFPGLKIMRF